MLTNPAASSSPRAPTASACSAGPAGDAAGGESLSVLERRLLDEFQRDFPLTPCPFATIAGALGCTQEQALRALEGLVQRGYVSRVGAVFAPHRIGHSILAALAVPAQRIDPVAALVNAYPEVNHNYEREHAYNLWFVVTAEDPARVEAVIADIENRTRLQALRLPLERSYHIDLGFALWR